MLDISIQSKLGLTFLFVFLNGFFVAAEFALVKVRPGRIDHLIKLGDRRAKLIQKVLSQMDLYLSGCQLGITLSSLILGWLAEPAIATLVTLGIDLIGVAIDPQIIHGISLAIAFTIITLLHMTLGEQAPKIWALKNAEKASLYIIYPLFGFVALFKPLIHLINLISNWLLRFGGGIKADGHDEALSVQEIGDAIQASAVAGQISHRQRMFANNVLSLVELEVRHIMLPRVEVTFLSMANTIEENIKIIRESGHSRFPLCKVGLDTVIGIVHTRDLLDTLMSKQEINLKKIARKNIHVPDTQPLSRFILEVQKSRQHAALVLDEHGTTVGFVFLEDALEEIVGPLGDEFDTQPPVIIEGENECYSFNGNHPLPDVVRRVGLDDTEDCDTVGGYVTAKLGRIPRKGDSISSGEYTLTVMKSSKTRVLQVEVKRTEEDAN